ncbi:MAG: hypothetical protein MUP41_11940 [Desulfobacterales bacterium]|nr:hypothetical protein [Desulfobacterales bacterium]
MARLDQQEGRYRVLLIGVGDNTEAKKDSFCHSISKNYNIPFPQLKKIVDRCPVILKKNLSLRKAEFLAKTFKSFGALVSVEESRQIPPISVEFQELAPHRLALESSSLRKSQRGTWSVTGRAKNISDETLNDTWVLIQLFEDFEEFIAFEETPLPINPLPSGQTSPFKVIFEGDLSIKKISIGFKNASGQPIPAVDKRKKRVWVKANMEDECPLSPPGMPTVFGEKSEAADLPEPLENMIVEKENEIPGDIPLSLEQEAGPTFGHEIREKQGDAERISEESISLPLEPLEKIMGSSSILVKEDGYPGGENSERALGQGTSQEFTLSLPEEMGKEIEAALDGLELASDEEEGTDESPLDASVFQEATQLLKDISESPKEAQVEEKTVPSFSWIGYFRDVVEIFYQPPHDIFSIWFEECRERGEFKDSLHRLLTILVHSRFDQGSQSNKALENTQKLFRLIAQPNLLLDEIPPLEGTSFVSGEVWRDLFQRALPKVHQIGNAILEKNKWNVFDLERLIRVIPHMGNQNSPMAIRWINELIPDVVEIDLSNAPITIGEGLYRVAARLGIVDPHLDYYQGRNSIADTKIRSFAIAAFPHNPVKVEKPMNWMGGGEERGGHCFPIQPWCDGCLFKTFCPRLYLDFNPSEKGMRD